VRSQRRHKRFKMDLIDINGKMSSAGKVGIIDISRGGVALKADRKLDIGKECLITLVHGEKRINVKGRVVRSELSGIEERAKGARVTVYSAGILFTEVPEDKIKDFLHSIEYAMKAELPGTANRHPQHIWLCITTPSEKILNYPEHFNVIEIGLSGILIQTEQGMKVENMILIDFSVNGCSPVSFMARVTSCRMTKDKDQAYYETRAEFIDLTERDRTLLIKFIDCFADEEY
jgi:PilZ domain-containing protein